MTNLVSVIIPSYKHKDYILNCLRSIAAQSYPNLELIVIDDGSGDGSAALVREFLSENQARFARAVFEEHAINRGLISTLREATAIARGDYLVLLASDDALLPSTIERQVAAMEARPQLGAISGNVERIDRHGRLLSRLRQHKYPAKEISFEEMWSRCNFSAPGAMIRASSFHAVGGYPANMIYEDWYLWLKLLDAGYHLYRSEDVYAYYRYHETNMHKNNVKMEQGKALVVAEFAHRPDFSRLLGIYRRAQERYAVSMAARHNKAAYVKAILRGESGGVSLSDFVALLVIW
jgi:alpha-1,3-rhamnosyltransferase